MIGKVLDFLFGKSPDIFDADGNVVHKFPQEKWQQWNNRFISNRDYDWRKHKGTEKRFKSIPPQQKPN